MTIITIACAAVAVFFGSRVVRRFLLQRREKASTGLAPALCDECGLPSHPSKTNSRAKAINKIRTISKAAADKAFEAELSWRRAEARRHAEELRKQLGIADEDIAPEKKEQS